MAISAFKRAVSIDFTPFTLLLGAVGPGSEFGLQNRPSDFIYGIVILE